MIKCSPEAFAKCPTRHLCGSPKDAIFAEGSDCDKFNRQIHNVPMTNADHIRAMSDEELAAFHANGGVQEACLRLAEEGYYPTTEQKMDLREKLYKTWIDWLQQPAEEG